MHRNGKPTPLSSFTGALWMKCQQSVRKQVKSFFCHASSHGWRISHCNLKVSRNKVTLREYRQNEILELGCVGDRKCKCLL